MNYIFHLHWSEFFLYAITMKWWDKSQWDICVCQCTTLVLFYFKGISWPCRGAGYLFLLATHWLGSLYNFVNLYLCFHFLGHSFILCTVTFIDLHVLLLSASVNKDEAEQNLNTGQIFYCIWMFTNTWIAFLVFLP